MAELTPVSAPDSAANQRDPSDITRMPRRAGFQPPLIVAELRFLAVRRETWATDAVCGSGLATGPMMFWVGSVAGGGTDATVWRVRPGPVAGGAGALVA